MPRSRVPSYRHHKQSGQAVVTLPDGRGRRRDITLGDYDTPESRAEYVRVVAAWEAAGRTLPSAPAGGGTSVNEILLAYWRFAETYYRKNGEPTSQQERIKRSLKPVRELYGTTPAAQFGPLALKAVRQQMIAAGWVRRHINQCVGCIRRAFKWAVAEELIPSSVLHGLQAVEGLKRGRCAAAESVPVRPVELEHVEATLPYLTGPVRAMVQLQLLAGMRPGEVCAMRLCDLDRGRAVWTYRPESHKTEHHGITRVICLGPQAQAVLRPFLDGRHPGDFLFQPAEAMAEFRARQRRERRSKVQPSQADRKRKQPRKQPGKNYTVTGSYGHAIDRGIRRANQARAAARLAAIPHWHAHQLRHTKATEIRKEAGLDAARAVLGHRTTAVTEVYAELDQAKAAEVMGRIG